VGGAVLVWFALAEVVTQIWYSSHEAGSRRNQLPVSGEAVAQRLRTFLEGDGEAPNEQKVDDVSMGILKASFGETLSWSQNGWPAAVTILKWDEKSTVGGAESMHNPGKCLSASGWKIGKQTNLGFQTVGKSTCDTAQWEVSRNGLKMLAFSAVFGRFAESVTPGETSFLSHSRNSRLRSVLEGRRDAPIFIILVYLPVSAFADTSEVRTRFQEILRALFTEPISETKS
jgi:hypothetical protein